MPPSILIKFNLILIQLGLTSREFVESHEREASYLGSHLAFRVKHDRVNYLRISLVSEVIFLQFATFKFCDMS